MNESKIMAVLTESATQLTTRGIQAINTAAAAEQRGDPTDRVDELRETGLTDLEAANRIQLLTGKTPAASKRGPSKGRKPGPRPEPAPSASPTYGNGIGSATYPVRT